MKRITKRISDDCIEIKGKARAEFGQNVCYGSKLWPLFKHISMLETSYEQIAWECDIAIEQLHELGYELGENIKRC